jgi:hypothetical protein
VIEPLYEAALAGNLDAAKALLANDPKPDVTDQDVSILSGIKRYKPGIRGIFDSVLTSITLFAVSRHDGHPHRSL